MIESQKGDPMRSAILAILVLVSGCSGVKFAGQALNEQVPTQLRERAALRKFTTYESNLPGLVGHFLYVVKDAAGQCPKTNNDSYDACGVGISSYVKQGVDLKPTNDAVLRYQSKVNAEITGQVAILVAAGNLSAQQAMEMVVTDTVTLALKDGDFDPVTVDGEFSKPLPAGACVRLFIRGAALSTVTYKTYSEIKADATTSGNAFSANGKTYGKGESFSLDYVLGLELYAGTEKRTLGVAPIRERVFGKTEPIPIDDRH